MLQLRQMDDRITVTREWFKDYNFHLVEQVQQVAKLVDMCIQRGIASLDCETTGVDNRVYPDEYFEDGIVTRNGIRTVDKIVGLCMSFDGQHGYYIPLAHEPEDSGNLPWDETWDEITRLVNGCRIIFHNMKFDAEFLYPVTGKDFWKIGEYEDTMLMSKIISPLKSHPAGLKQRTKLDFGVEMVELDELFTDEKKEQMKREKVRYNFSLLHPREGLEYGCSDGIFTFKEYFVLRDRVDDGGLTSYNLEKSFCNVMRKMERNRVHVDVDRIRQLFTDCNSAIVEVGDLIRDFVESKTGRTGKWLTLNVGSPQQLSIAFFTDPEGLKLKPTPEMIVDENGGWGTNYDDGGSDDDDDDDSGKPKVYSVKDEVLKSLDRHYGKSFSIQRKGIVDKDGKPKPESIFELTLEYRHYEKMNGSYIEKLLLSHDKYGDVRPSFNQMGTDTTRLSCKAGKIDDGYSGVNFQGIPRDSDDDKPELFKQIRTVIIPRPGWVLVKIDYSGEELRVVTNMSGDPIWTESFLHGDGDVHSITTRTLYGRSSISKDERNRGKRCNFAFIYGGGAGAISRNVGCSMEDSQRHMDNLRRDVPVLMGYVDHQKKFARKYKCIYTAFGRKIPIPTIDSPIRGIRAKAERCAINYTIQATSADILKYAMCLVDKKIKELGWEDKVRYVLTVHDEVVYEVRPDSLMEVVPLLDEWMTLPWKLPKAHGREWTVPLETEPGIDIHWRARYDFFLMTRGTAANKKDFDKDGNFVGKLKKGQYFADGRVYQEIPDFLAENIRRLPLDENGKPITDLEPDKVFPNSSHAKLQISSPSNQPKSLMLPESSETKSSEDLGSESSEDLGSESSMIPESLEPEQSAEDLKIKSDDAELDDLDLDSFKNIQFSDSETEGELVETKLDDRKSSKPETQTTNSTRVIKPVGDDERVLRWTFKGVMSNESMRKLTAVCVLSEGNVPLRVVSQKGSILISEDEGLRVDQEKFKVLTGLFGLG